MAMHIAWLAAVGDFQPHFLDFKLQFAIAMPTFCGCKGKGNGKGKSERGRTRYLNTLSFRLGLVQIKFIALPNYYIYIFVYIL